MMPKKGRKELTLSGVKYHYMVKRLNTKERSVVIQNTTTQVIHTVILRQESVTPGNISSIIKRRMI